MPKTVNPSSGAVYNANNSPFEATDGKDGFSPEQLEHYIGIERQMTNRALRIKRLLSQNEQIDFAKFREIKYDTFYDIDNELVLELKYFLDTIDLQTINSENRSYAEAFAQGIELLKNWDLNTDIDNKAAALGVLTLMPYIHNELKDNNPPPIEQSFANAIKHLLKHFGKIDPTYGDVNKLYRGDKSWSMSGGPDIVRAVYGYPPNEKGELVNIAGDSYILFARWDENGTFSASSVHNFGSATLDETSPHYDDQSPLFVAQEEKTLELDAIKLREKASSITAFGAYKD